MNPNHETKADTPLHNGGRVLCISLSGIGNTILFTPFIAALRKYHPNLSIDLLTWSPAAAECLTESGLLNRAIWFPEGLFSKILFVFNLRRCRYAYTVTAIPSNRWLFHAFSFFVGAPNRVVHAYGTGALRTLSFLSNRKVPAIEGRHDIENNLQLLAPFGIDPGQADPKPLFVLNRESRDCVSRWLATEAIPDGIRLVGIHAGAGPLGDRKKWGLNNFTREIRNVLTQDPTAHIIIFGGKEEANEKAELAELTASANIHIFSGSLMETAACIERCHFFVSNDTGLMHIAAVYGIPQKAIFISTSISRTRPWNDNAEVLDLTHGADYSYPFRSCKP